MVEKTDLDSPPSRAEGRQEGKGEGETATMIGAADASEAEIRAILGAMDAVILILDGDGRYVRVVPTRPDLLYKPSGELLGKTLHEVMSKELADDILAHVRRALETRGVVPMEYSLTIGGKSIWFEASLSRMGDNRVLLIARDETARRRAEEALRQSILQEGLIRAEARALADLAMPLIPITDEIIVMPLVGQLDEQRVERATATLLAGIAAKKARVAILDITGVPTIDARVAGGLVRAARAAELLGARVELTGIKSEVAQILVTLGVELGGLATRGTLQDGIACALGLARR